MKINEVSTPQTDAAGPNRMKSAAARPVSTVGLGFEIPQSFEPDKQP